jgi:phage repressor protein C with HTH and peptisase S24 domain
MFTHEDVWRAIDLLAKKNGLSTSALARKAGLDATSFNRSKRITANGRPRWPSSESLSKVLRCTNTTLAEFTLLMGGDGETHVRLRLPIAHLHGETAPRARFDGAGRPSGDGWEEIPCPGMNDATAFALRVCGDAFHPVYRDGDVIIASTSASIREGDRAVVALKDGRLLIRAVTAIDREEVRLTPLAGDGAEHRHSSARPVWMARILWVSQ